MKGSLIIVSFFIVGTLCGFFHLIPYDFTDSKLSYYALCGLMFCVGTSIGNDPNTLKSFRSLNPRLMFLPIMTILGTLAGCAVAGFFMSQRSSSECMAIGAGFGYYSLSSIFITEYNTLFWFYAKTLLILLKTSCFVRLKRNKIYPGKSRCHYCTLISKAFSPVTDRLFLNSSSFIYGHFHAWLFDLIKALDISAVVFDHIQH